MWEIINQIKEGQKQIYL